MHALRVNEIELPSETAFVADPFALEGKKNLKYYQKTVIWNFPHSLDASLTLSLQNVYIVCFIWTTLALGIFWQLPAAFRN